MRLLLITPPMAQLDPPYPATAYLMGFLRQHAAALDLELAQADASIELFLRVFSGRGLQQILDELTAQAEHTDEAMPPSIASLLEHGARYVATIDAVTQFLQGRDPWLALRITGRELLPEGPRFAAAAQGPGAGEADPLDWAFGGLGVADRAKYLASLYIDDLADAIREALVREQGNVSRATRALGMHRTRLRR